MGASRRSTRPHDRSQTDDAPTARRRCSPGRRRRGRAIGLARGHAGGPRGDFGPEPILAPGSAAVSAGIATHAVGVPLDVGLVAYLDDPRTQDECSGVDRSCYQVMLSSVTIQSRTPGDPQRIGAVVAKDMGGMGAFGWPVGDWRYKGESSVGVGRKLRLIGTHLASSDFGTPFIGFTTPKPRLIPVRRSHLYRRRLPRQLTARRTVSRDACRVLGVLRRRGEAAGPVPPVQRIPRQSLLDRGLPPPGLR